LTDQNDPATLDNNRCIDGEVHRIIFKKPFSKHIRHNLNQIYLRIRSLQGDPHYMAMGMAIGVFIGVTPTFPFHTALAIALAFVLRGSKPAAIIGVWFGNPVTMPFFYLASYKIGVLILGHQAPFDLKYESIKALFSLGWEVAVAMLVGGLILGLPPALIFYFLTLVVFKKISRARFARDHKKKAATDDLA
jgi:uncharacterized protein